MPVTFTQFLQGRPKADPIPPEFKAPRRTKNVTISLTKSQHEALQHLAAEQGITLGSTVKSIVLAYVHGDLT
jgi:hypothetical protein